LTQAAAHAEALMEADELKAALMASISHDLKTPLAGIKTSVSNLLDAEITWSDDDLRAFLETIDSQADRLNRVISDILDLNRIESGVVRPKLEPLEAGALFREAAARASLLTGSRVVTIDTDPSVRLVADESLLVQAIVNLVENAAKYSTPGSAIHLEALTDGDHVRLVVEDEGPGIAARDLPYVFDRFYRAAETSRRVKGSGLGLAIVKGFVSLSGGTASVESSPAGTRFIVTLPAARHAATQR
jgi:two-component system sensor histidine kinase KdpD